MKVLFVNPPEPQCGVHQYGLNLFNVLKPSTKHSFEMCHPSSLEVLAQSIDRIQPEAVIYNWSAPIGGWMADAPFHSLVFPKRHVAIYHADTLDPGLFDAVLFSDPTTQPQGNIVPIGRPLPQAVDSTAIYPHEGVWIGVNGFCGAWAQNVAKLIVEQFEEALVRLHLPSATFGDPYGAKAKHTAKLCHEILSVKRGLQLDVFTEFMPIGKLVHTLAQNDLNCYIRHDQDFNDKWGLGVASVLDVALAARRPIAINRFKGFRHLHNCRPSVCVEDNSLKDIIANGIEPLKAVYERNDPARVRAEVEECLTAIA